MASSDQAGDEPALLFGERLPMAVAYAAVRQQTEELAAPLSPEDQCLQSMPDASPVKWHLAHTSWFFETFVLKAFAPDCRPFDARFDYLFNSYYEAAGPRHPRAARGILSRPSSAVVHAYRAHVDSAMRALLEARPPQAVIDITTLGLRHEEQHQELILMDIKHLFSLNSLDPAYAATDPFEGVRLGSKEPKWRRHTGGLVEIGAAENSFSFDNERPRHKVWLEPFLLADRLVTNGEYLAFIADGGYSRPDLWLSDGWALAASEGWRAPLYWRSDNGGGWRIFTLAGEQALDPQAPVLHVSYYEADAFARWAGTKWRGARLPTEAEWEIAAITGPDAYMGGAWVWTQSPYTPYPGFKAEAGALGEYNGKFMCNQMVLRGGSAATPRSHATPTYRNFYPPAARWAFSGIRLARDV